jgi:aminoglycoside/choline kinase family phosphotransferase
MPSDFKEFVLDFLKEKGLATETVDVIPLRGDGSKRIFWRIALRGPESSFIAVANPPTDQTSKRENFAYLMIGKHLHQKGIPVPEIYSYDLEKGWFLVEDMGQKTLQDIVSAERDFLSIYTRLVEHLFRLQTEGAKGFDAGWCSQTERYDRTVMRQYEADYFRHAFLHHYLGLKKEWPELETPFNYLAETASGADSGFFLHRDFQSRNIMISKGNIGIVDWQGGRLGPLGYDLASLLIDPYSDLSPHDRESLFERYLILLREHNAALVDPFRRYYPYLAIQRNLQILGAFSYLTKIMKKSYFQAYIPTALHNLHELLLHVTEPELSPLRDLVKDINPLKKTLDMPHFNR